MIYAKEGQRLGHISETETYESALANGCNRIIVSFVCAYCTQGLRPNPFGVNLVVTFVMKFVLTFVVLFVVNFVVICDGLVNLDGNCMNFGVNLHVNFGVNFNVIVV